MNKTNVIAALLGCGTGLAGLPAQAITAIGPPAALLNTATFAGVELIGPAGEVISYKMVDGKIQLRLCAQYASQSEVESGSGCRLAEGTDVITIDPADFRGMVQQGLHSLSLAPNSLSDDQRALLERELTDIPDLSDKQAERTRLRARLARLESFKEENPDDYDPAQEKTLLDRIHCIDDALAQYKEVTDARDQIAAIVGELVSNMDGNPSGKILKHSQVGGTIAYNLLRAIAKVEECDPETMRIAPAGYMCQAGRVLWRVGAGNYAGRRIYVDMRSGMKVTGMLGLNKMYEAHGRCNHGFRLPSGTPDQTSSLADDSDFQTLINDNIGQVVPDLHGNQYWSSSYIDGPPEEIRRAYAYRGGRIILDDVGNDAEVLCVSGGKHEGLSLAP